MEENCMIELVGEFGSDSEALLKASDSGMILYKNVSCQTMPGVIEDISVPIMFCTLLSSVCEASTQVTLPVRSSEDISAVPLEKITRNIRKDCKLSAHEVIKSKETKGDITDRTIENVSKHSEKRESESTVMPLDSDGLEDEPSLLLSPEEDDEPEDSEFSSDNDLAFWQKMKQQAKKQRIAKSKRQRTHLKYPSGFSVFSYKESKCLSENGATGACQKLLKNKECDKDVEGTVSFKTEPGAEDDWITDDEADEEGVNFDLAFKKEWKEKRHPYNTKEKKFLCEVCGRKYSKHHYLREHIVREHKEHEQAKKYPYCCQHCKRLYSGERQLMHHQQQHSGPCEICGLMLECSGLFWVHRRNHDAQCKVCGKAFQAKGSLDMHMKIKHSENTIPCPMCHRKFPFQFLKNRHVAKAHTSAELMQHKCNVCDFWAKTEGALRIHQRRIHNIKLDVYTCEECSAKFATKLSYNKHIAVHVSKSNIVCQLCSQKFLCESDLQAHKKSVHDIAVATFTETIQKPNPSNQVILCCPCTVCNVNMTSLEELHCHMQKFHSMDIDVPKKMKEEAVESIQVTEVDETSVAVMQINVNNEEPEPKETPDNIKEEPTYLDLSSNYDYNSARSALLMPASVVPPNVNIVDINGVKYHVIRGSQ